MGKIESFQGLKSALRRSYAAPKCAPRSQPPIRILILLCAVATALTGCGPSGAVTKECILPPDQAGTLKGRWASGPIPVAVQSNAFSSSENAAISAAISTWNAFGKASFGRALFDAFEGGALRQSSIPRSTAMSCAGTGVVSGSTYTAPLTLYKATSWAYGGSGSSTSTGGSSSTIALTSTCPSNGSSAGASTVFNNGMIEINFQDYFSAGKPQPDLQSIVLHELGHLAGLDHTCEANARAGMPGCGSAPQEYRVASLFPSFASNGGNGGGYESRRSLNANDQGRMNCLYGNSKSPSTSSATSTTNRR